MNLTLTGKGSNYHTYSTAFCDSFDFGVALLYVYMYMYIYFCLIDSVMKKMMIEVWKLDSHRLCERKLEGM